MKEAARVAREPEAPLVGSVDEAIASRRSVRAFLPAPVQIETVMKIIGIAGRAASGNNTQPWLVRVVTGEMKQRLTGEILAEFNDPARAAMNVAEFDSYPSEWKSPYRERRRAVGVDMYTLLGIQKGDVARMHAQTARNFSFFDAPVGLIFTLDRVFVPGSAVDLGMFMGNVMIAARARGLDTCPQAAFGIYHKVVRRVLRIPDSEVVICGMALGFADTDAPLDKLVTHREPVSSFVTVFE